MRTTSPSTTSYRAMWVFTDTEVDPSAPLVASASAPPPPSSVDTE